jgi:hypothetical protein
LNECSQNHQKFGLLPKRFLLNLCKIAFDFFDFSLDLVQKICYNKSNTNVCTKIFFLKEMFPMKKILSALLLASMLVAALASCASGEDTTTTTGSTTPVATTTTQKAPPQTQETEAEPEPDTPLVPGAGLEDLGKGLCTQVGTSYSTLAKGPRYLALAEGYITRMGLDADDQIIGYEFVNLGRMMEMIKKGEDANDAMKKATGSYGRFADAVKYIDPRNE